jgi:DNA-binding beta-propeller fold protein YncE
MTLNDRHTTFTPDQLGEVFTDLAAPNRPDYRDDLFRRTARTRQRPAWTYIERWLPVTIVTARQATAPPLRSIWTLLLVGVLTAALIAGLAIAGSRWMRGPDLQLEALAPVLVDGDPIGTAGLSAPMGIDVGPGGNVYLVNSGTDEIVVLDPAGRELRRWGGPGSGEGQFLFKRDPADPLNSAGGVAVGPDGSVYVTDMINDRVQRFTADGGYVSAWGEHGPGDGQFLEPFDIDVGPDGSVYVVDDLRDDIQRFSADGEWIQTIGRHGPADGELDSTGGIGVDSTGLLLNADFGNGRIQAWDEDGVFLWSRPTGPDPVDVVADAKGGLYVTMAGEGVKLFEGGSELVSVSTLPGWEVGYVAAADDGTVYVSNPAADRIDRLTVRYEEVGDTPERPAVGTGPDPTAPESIDDGATGAATAESGGPLTVSSTTFEVPFSAQLPSSTTDAASGEPGWWLQVDEPGVAAFQYVRDPERTPADVDLYLPAGVFRDPCHPEDGMLTTSDRPTVDELVEAFTKQVGVRVGPITDISFGDVRGKAFVLENNIDMTACTDQPWLRHWSYRVDGMDGEATEKGIGLPDTRRNIAIVDVRGVPVLIDAWELGARRDEVAQAYQLFESIRFE